MRKLLVGAVALALALPVGRAAAGPASKRDASAFDHLEKIVKLSPAPAYRRFGTAAAAKVADYAADQLAKDGFHVVRQDVGGLTRWMVDYRRGNQPRLTRVSDGHRFKVDSAFEIGTTAADGIECTVKKIADVGPGDCGFVPFAEASPEWKNPTAKASSDVADIANKGGVGAVIQGNVERNLVFALRLRSKIPALVAVTGDDIVGQRVRLRAMGTTYPAIAHNVVGVLRPPAGSSKYVMLLGHLDGWYQAAADNGGGAADILRAADLLATQKPGVGVVAALMDGEEWGLLGSKALAQQLSAAEGLAVGDGGPALHMDDLKAVVNLDASSARASDVQDHIRGAAGTDAPVFSWRAMVYSEEPTMAAIGLTTFANHQVLGLPVPSRGAIAAFGSWRTDAQWFHEAGVPVIWPVAGYPEYHTDGDLPSAMDAADLEAVADGAADLVGKLATAPIGRVPDPFRK